MNDSLELMRARLDTSVGVLQQDKMIRDKRKTFDRVVLYSYQGALVQAIGSTDEPARALINPNKVKQDYDDKIISIGYEYNYKPGTIFNWINTETTWLVYLQDLTELAYFKGDIRKCNYEIKWYDEDRNVKSTYAAVRGPIETQIDSTTKNNFNLDTPNHTLNILLPASEEILKYFKRYAKFYIKPLKTGDTPVCWRVEATDTISMPGILEITAEEYYSNEDKDDIEQGLVDDWTEPVDPQDQGIEGETFIKPKKTYKYVYTGTAEPVWSYDDPRLPIEANINGNEITIKWKATYSGKFVLTCADQEKTIVVDLF